MRAFSGDLKLFVTDLDGTVLVDQGERGCHGTPRLKAALRALQAGGVTVCLASGRMHESIRMIAGEMGVRGPIISYNGGMLCAADGEVLASRTLDAELAAEIVEIAEARELSLNYYADGLLYARKIQPWWDLYHGRTSSPMREVAGYRGLRGKRPFKLLIYAQAVRVRELKAELEPRFEGRCRFMVTADEYLEVVPLGVDKGPALAELARHLGLQAGQTAAAGDGWNDVGMLQWAGLAIAMDSGRDELKRFADAVVPGPERDGLARFIEDRFLGAAAGSGRG